MYRGQDFDVQKQLPLNEQALTQDLELTTLFGAMAAGDKFLFEIARKAILSGSDSVDTILYRQEILRDCLENQSVIIDIYNLTVEAIERERKDFFRLYRDSPGSVLYRSRGVLQMLLSMLRKLRSIADLHSQKFRSEGLSTLFAMLQKELSDEYFAAARSHLKQLTFRDGVLVSAKLGKGNKGANYVLRKHPGRKQSWMREWIDEWLRWLLSREPPAYTFYLHPRDEGGARVLSELRNRGINIVANTLAQSTDHILSFFHMLRTELAFYIGCMNLHAQLMQRGEPISFPLPVEASQRKHAFASLYDVCLALNQNGKVIGNEMSGDGKTCVIITGANQGGKSTFLRSIGLSQLMMQAGMFVPAKSFRANICRGIFSHFKREEDITMSSGKLDEELSRMSKIIENINNDSMILFNESFSATNEREGSEIARQIILALLEKNIKVFFVTHLYDFAYNFFAKKMENVMFLRAERQSDGRRTFKLIEGEPLETSYGEDLYREIFAREWTSAIA